MEQYNFQTANGCALPDGILYPQVTIHESTILSEPDLIPSKLKEYRKIRKLTLRQVEEATGISNAYLSQLETGKTANPAFKTMVTLLRYYNVKVII